MIGQKELSPEERITKAKTTLLRKSPFFGYLVQYLRFREGNSDEVPTMGITEDSIVYFNPDFVDTLSDEELKAIIAHEVMHKAMRGFKRQGSRDHQKWNVAQDLVINYILKHENGFDIPLEIQSHGEGQKGETYTPDENGDYTGEFEIEDIDDKSFESVYAEVPEDAGDQGLDIHISAPEGQGSSGQGDGNNSNQGDSDASGGGAGGSNPYESNSQGSAGGGEGDDDQSGSGGDGDQNVQGESPNGDEDGAGGIDDKRDVDWETITAQAAQHAQSQGSAPGGLEQFLDINEDGEVDFREYIHQMIEDHTPSDYTFTRRSKAGRSLGIHLPDTEENEGLEVVVVLDTSGSVSDALLERFVGEIRSLIDTYNNVDMVVIQHDAKVQDVSTYEGTTKDDFEKFQVAGRGGTSHVPVFEYLEEERLDVDKSVMINLTDGYTTVPDEKPSEINEILWVLNNYEVDLDRLKHGDIIRIEPEDGF